MSRKVTMRKLAKELGLAPSTVHRAISGNPNVGIRTRRKVLNAAHAKGYLQPLHRCRNIAIIVPSFSFFGYLQCIIPKLESALHRNNLAVQLISQHDIAALHDHMYDGIILLVWKKGLEKLLPQEYSIPIICLNATPNLMDNVPMVASEEKEGITMALEYLHNHNCHKIFYIATSVDNDLAAMERLEAFREYCSRTGQAFDGMHLEICWLGLNGALELILKNSPDACFCASENYALQLGQMLLASKIRIPQHISLMGLEDTAFNSMFTPPITAIRQDFERLSELTVQSLCRMIEDGVSTYNLRVPYKLIERNSVK